MLLVISVVCASILAELANAPDATVKQIAGFLGIPASTCAFRIRALRSRGVIAGLRLAIDPSAVGAPVQAMIRVRLMVLDEDLAAARQLLDEQIVEARHVFGEDAFDQEVFDDDEDDGPSILVHRRTRLLRWGVMLLAAAFLAPLIVALVD